MTSKMDILGTLTKARLLELTAVFAVNGLAGKSKESVVEALARSRQATAKELLAQLYRDELKHTCRALGLDDSGRAKEAIIDRLLSTPARGEPAGRDERATRRVVRALLRSGAFARPPIMSVM